MGEKRKRGRPKMKGSRTSGFHTRLSDFELDILKEASEKSGLSMSEIVRVGMLKYASELNSKTENNDL